MIMNSNEELLRHSMNENGYYLLLVSRDAVDFFKTHKAEKDAELDFKDRHHLRLIIRGNYQSASSHYYGSKESRVIVGSLFACSFHNFLESVKIDDFKTYTTKAFQDYCSLKKLKEDEIEKLQSLSVSGSEIGRTMNRGWFNELYEVKGDKIRLRCCLRDVVIPNTGS